MADVDLKARNQPLRTVGGCLHAAWKAWQNLGADQWVVSVLRFGYRVPFEEPPPLSPSPISFESYSVGSLKQQALSEEVRKMVEKGALEPVSQPGPGFYSRIFLVPKATGGWRPVIDVSALNRFVDLTKFKMETPASVLESVRPGDFMASIDLKDAYFQIPIHPSSRKYLRFVWEGKTYQFKALCFGLSSAPQVFTRVMAPVSVWAHQHGVRLRRYLDDWLISNETRDGLIQDTEWLLQLCSTLGIVVNHEKSNLEPSQRVSYLGMLLDTVESKAFPVQKRISRLLEVANEFRLRPAPSAGLWLRLLGHLASLEKLVPGGRSRMRNLQWNLKRAWSASEDDMEDCVLVSSLSLQDLDWWCQEENLTRGVSLVAPQPQVFLSTDASKVGWGAHLLDFCASGLWHEDEIDEHINQLELKAILHGLRSFQDQLQGKTVALLADNSTALAYVRNQGGTQSEQLCHLAREIQLWTESHQVTLLPRFLPGHLNVVADGLSRPHQAVSSEWSLHPDVCRQLFRLWGSPLVDLFATHLNNKLPLYVSPLPDPAAWKEDALLIPWDDLETYAFPPFALIRRIVSKLRDSVRSRMILVAPFWPQREWFPDLLDLLAAVPRELPLWPSLLRQPGTGQFHGNIAMLKLHAWRLSSDSTEREAFRRELREECPLRDGSLPWQSTSLDGHSSAVGVVGGVFVPSLPLCNR